MSSIQQNGIIFFVLMESGSVLVMENGSRTCKIGIAGEDNPTVTLLSCVDGDGTLGIHDGTFPIKRGIVQHWNIMEQVWSGCFNEMKCDVSEKYILMEIATCTPGEDREKMAEIMFEKFTVRGLNTSDKAQMTILACGKMSGVVVQSGDCITETSWVCEGRTMPNCNGKMDLGGHDMTKYLRKKLLERDINVTYDTAKIIKEKLGSISAPYSDRISSFDFTLPDGKVISVGQELQNAVDSLFEPSLIGKTMEGVHELLFFKTFMKMDIDNRFKCWSEIKMGGGNNYLKGFGGRLQHEIYALAPCGVKVNVIGEREPLTWQGGSIWGSLQTFPACCVTKEQYEENGPSIIRNSFINVVV